MAPKEQHGFIFLMTLIITTIISLLILNFMQHILLYHKAINKQEEFHQQFYQLEEIALYLGQSGSITLDCVSYKDSANQVMQKLAQGGGCSLKRGEFEYHYFIEDLGVFPCLLVNKNGKKHASYHHRISVVQMDEGYPASFLQERFIWVGPILNCLAQEHFVHLGISSWRYFTSIPFNKSWQNQ
ncbi:type II secretion system protein [Legionella sp.]|uniref:type II secretion system protein n=1 Tax=Legionella sp. TaxID=459 RepID=UPI003CA162B9